MASIYGALKSEKPWWETWKTHYLWTSITYLVGAIAAGILAELVNIIGFGVVIAAAPIIVFVYLTYRMYLKNVEMSLSQAEQAEHHADDSGRTIASRLPNPKNVFAARLIMRRSASRIVSPDGKWLKVNKALSEILGYTEEEFLATDFQSMIYAEDLGDTLVKIHELLSGKVPDLPDRTALSEQTRRNRLGFVERFDDERPQSRAPEFDFPDSGHHRQKTSRRTIAV